MITARIVRSRLRWVRFERKVELWYDANWTHLSVSIPIEKVRAFPHGSTVRVTIERLVRR